MYIWSKAIDSAAVYDITPKTTCKRIEVREDYDSATPPTVDLRQFDQTDSAGARGCKVAKGTSAIYTAVGTAYNQQDGRIAGYIKTASGSCTVVIIEHEKV